MDHKISGGRFIGNMQIFREKVAKALEKVPDGQWIDKNELGELADLAPEAIKNRIQSIIDFSIYEVCEISGIVAKRRLFANERTVKDWLKQKK